MTTVDTFVDVKTLLVKNANEDSLAKLFIILSKIDLFTKPIELLNKSIMHNATSIFQKTNVIKKLIISLFETCKIDSEILNEISNLISDQIKSECEMKIDILLKDAVSQSAKHNIKNITNLNYDENDFKVLEQFAINSVNTDRKQLNTYINMIKQTEVYIGNAIRNKEDVTVLGLANAAIIKRGRRPHNLIDVNSLNEAKKKLVANKPKTSTTDSLTSDGANKKKVGRPFKKVQLVTEQPIELLTPKITLSLSSSLLIRTSPGKNSQALESPKRSKLVDSFLDPVEQTYRDKLLETANKSLCDFKEIHKVLGPNLEPEHSSIMEPPQTIIEDWFLDPYCMYLNTVKIDQFVIVNGSQDLDFTNFFGI
jgi:hypothetical protein